MENILEVYDKILRNITFCIYMYQKRITNRKEIEEVKKMKNLKKLEFDFRLAKLMKKNQK